MKTVGAILYPVLLLAAAAVLLRGRRPHARRMGVCVLISALSWACLLVPGLLTGLPEPEYRLWLGLGRLGEAVGSAVRIFLLYRLWERMRSPDVRDRLLFLVCAVGVLVRLLALIPPENRWMENGFSLLWSSISCGGLLIAGAVPAAAWHSSRDRDPALRPVWLLLLVFLAFAIPLSAAGRFPILHWLRLPQMAASLGAAVCFLRYSR